MEKDKLIENFFAAFSWRKAPEKNAESESNSDAYFFISKPWSDISINDWNEYSDAIFEFDKNEFCYYIQSIIFLNLKFNRSDFIALNYFVDLFDVDFNKQNWTNEFHERIYNFTAEELVVLYEWMSGLDEDCFGAFNSKDRALLSILTVLSK